MDREPAKDSRETGTAEAPGAGNMSAHSPAESETLPPSRNAIDTQLRSILCDILGLEREAVENFDNDTGLFGHLPELDSMAVAGLLTEIEDRLDILIDDDEVDGELFETLGSLTAFIRAKVAG